MSWKECVYNSRSLLCTYLYYVHHSKIKLIKKKQINVDHKYIYTKVVNVPS